MNSPRRLSAWMVWTALAVFSWGVWAVLSKALGEALTADQSQALSTLGLLPILAVLAGTRSGRNGLKGASRSGFTLALAGGIVSALGNLAYYGALARGEKVATVVALTALYPLTTIALAVALLGERLNRVQLLGLGLSLVAIWLFNVQPDGSILSRTILYALPPVVLWGLSGFLQKVATNHISGEAAALVYLGAFVPVAIVLGLRAPWPEPARLTPSVWAIVLALGFFLGFGNLAILAAFARGGQAAIITPLTGLYPIISVPAAVLLFHEKLGGRELAGILCALASVAALSRESTPAPAQVNTVTVT